MKNKSRALACAGFVLCAAAMSAAPPATSSVWHSVDESTLGPAVAGRRLATSRYRTLALDHARLQEILDRAPMESSAAARATEIVLDLPWPTGGFRRFRIEESPIMEPALAAEFSRLKTYRGQGIDDGTATVRLDWSPNGFHAFVLSGEGEVYVDPHSPGDTFNYRSYFKADYRRTDGAVMHCLASGEETGSASRLAAARNGLSRTEQFRHGATLRTYRLAVAATGEYTAFQGGTVLAAMNGIVTTMNRVNGIYERDLAVRMVLIGGSSSLVYTDGAADPYTNENGRAMSCENARNLDAVIGIGNYDIGHVFSTGGGGVAGLGVVCNDGNACGTPSGSHKARGVSGSPSPIGDAFDVDYVAHEVGHQFGGPHTFNGTTSSCGGGNRDAANAFEPGSGSTIQAHAGICGAENLQPNSDAYFHAGSQDDMLAFITGSGSTCAVSSATGNTPPTVNAGADFTIPANTPFVLTATGSDADGDSLTYTWEQMDAGAAAPPNTDEGTRALFRSFLPGSAPSRTFPRLSNLINNVSPPAFGESMPTTTRALNFRVTVRDNRAGGGGTASDDVVVNTRADAGPFAVTWPNTALTITGVWAQTITWNVANTLAAPINTANVKISLSVDGGNTFPIVLAASTPNDGSETVTITNTPTTQARIKVEAVGNIFFDISDVNFTINLNPSGFSIHDVFVTESNTGARNATFVVRLSVPSASTTSVQYQTENGTATAGSDYVALGPATLTFLAGEQEKLVSVAVHDDLLQELAETFEVRLFGATGAMIHNGSGTGMILDNDAVTCPGVVAPGASFTATVNADVHRPGSAADWIAMYAPGWSDYPLPSNWRYVPLPRPNTQTFTASSTPGNYRIRLFANDTFQNIGECRFKVSTGAVFSINDVWITEGNDGTSNATFTVAMSPASSTRTVKYETASGTAAGNDYTAIPPTVLTFLPGETSKQVVVSIMGDVQQESDETFFVRLFDAAPGTAVAIADGQGVGTIIDNEAAPAVGCPSTVSPGASLAATVNGGTSATDWLALYAAEAPHSPLPPNWRHVPLPRPKTQTFTAPMTPGNYHLRLFASDTVTLIGVCPFAVAAVPTFTVSDVSVTEGNTANVNATFTVTLSPSAGVTTMVQYQTANGTAAAGSDYAAVGLTTLTFLAGETMKTLTVTVSPDLLVEASETFLVNLSNATGGAMIGDSQGVGTIVDDDAPPAVSCPSTVAPGASFTATVNGGNSSLDWLAMYASGAPNTPVPPGWGYVRLPRPNTQTFTASMTPGSYQLRLFANDTFTVIGTCPFTVAVVPTFTIDDVSVTEGNTANANATFTVTLSPAAGGTTTVQYQSANGTAAAGSDYTAVGLTTLTFVAGETTKTLTVTVSPDLAIESNETFFVNLSNASGGAMIGDSQGLGTILDNDAPPAVSCPSTVAPGASFTATVNGGSSSLDWLAMYASGAPNTPVPPGWRYVPLPRPNTQTFAASTTPGSYQLRLFANDTFMLIGTCPFTVATVPTFTIDDVSVTEGNTATVNATFTVTLSPAAGGTTTVQYQTANGTAVAGSDYTAVGLTPLTFLPGETVKALTVTVSPDLAVESNETFFVNLLNATGGAVIGDGQGIGTIVDNDAPPTVACPATVNPAASFTATVNGGSSGMDWLAMYASGAPNSPFPANWRYVPLPRPNAQTFMASATPGSYQLRLFANDTFTVIGICSFDVP